jgi:hypothetical protein
VQKQDSSTSRQQHSKHQHSTSSTAERILKGFNGEAAAAEKHATNVSNCVANYNYQQRSTTVLHLKRVFHIPAEIIKEQKAAYSAPTCAV